MEKPHGIGFVLGRGALYGLGAGVLAGAIGASVGVRMPPVLSPAGVVSTLVLLLAVAAGLGAAVSYVLANIAASAPGSFSSGSTTASKALPLDTLRIHPDPCFAPGNPFAYGNTPSIEELDPNRRYT